jgi:hypothetical protein
MVLHHAAAALLAPSQVDAAKAHVPGCEEWGKPEFKWCEREQKNVRVSAILITPDMQPQLGQLLKGVCGGRMVGGRSTLCRRQA